MLLTASHVHNTVLSNGESGGGVGLGVDGFAGGPLRLFNIGIRSGKKVINEQSLSVHAGRRFEDGNSRPADETSELTESHANYFMATASISRVQICSL